MRASERGRDEASAWSDEAEQAEQAVLESLGGRACTGSTKFPAYPMWTLDIRPLRLEAAAWRVLLERQGPSLGLWRAAEVAALREQRCQRPILDLGCGDGLVTSLALGRVEVGLDPDERALERAERLGTYHRIVPARMQDAALPDESMATVVSNSVLEHLPALDDTLQAVARVLRPGGGLIFTAPTEAFGSQLLLPVGAYAARRNRQLDHLNLWTAQQWAERLSRAGLDLLLLRPYLRPMLVRAWDALELTQQVWVARKRIVGLAWRRIPPASFERLAQWAARLDLSSPAPGGGRLIIARKR